MKTSAGNTKLLDQYCYEHRRSLSQRLLSRHVLSQDSDLISPLIMQVNKNRKIYILLDLEGRRLAKKREVLEDYFFPYSPRPVTLRTLANW